MQYIEILNANPGVAALIGLTVAAILFACVLSAKFKHLARETRAQYAEAERARRRQHSELLDRVERADQRTVAELELLVNMLTGTAKTNDERLDKMLTKLSESIDRQRREADELREQFDRRLQSTLEKRLGESFRQVSQQLERVYKGLGEMQMLATGVGDLKRVLTGVKTRGVWGETQLAAVVEQILTPDQYLTNTPVEPNATERVEFAVVLPGRSEDGRVLLPIDAKYPQEDYERLLAYQEAGDKQACQIAGVALEKAILREADRIHDKYIRVPHTTDFAILFLPIEGLYAEALRRPGLADKAQKRHIMLAGPTTLAALLNSLQMGFQTLAVEQRSREIWALLGSVRAEFTRFGDALDKAKARIEQAGQELDGAALRTRQIGKQLKRMDTLTPDTTDTLS